MAGQNSVEGSNSHRDASTDLLKPQLITLSQWELHFSTSLRDHSNLYNYVEVQKKSIHI